MAALTSAGPWLADAAFVPAAAATIVYARVNPRLLLTASSAAATSTVIPLSPPFTRYPVSP